jgi:uncharacterized protein (TIRG00374 family)
MDAGLKSRVITLVRWGVTAAAVTWVLLKIDWRDQVRTVGGQTLRGHVELLDDRFVVTGSDGVSIEVMRDADRRDEFQPGFLTLLKNIQPLYLAVALVVYPFANVFGAVRWKALLRAHRIEISFRRCLQLTWMGFFWSLIFPGVTGGDVVKAYAAARTAEKRAVSVLTVFFDRLIGLVALAFLSGLVILFNLHNEELRAVSTGILVFISIMVGGGVWFYSRRLRRWLGFNWLIGLLPFRERVAQIDDALFQYRYHKKTLIGSVIVSLVAHVVNVGAFFLIGESLGLGVAWQHYFVFIPVVLMVAALPFSVGGIGVLEGGVAHFLTLRGVGATVSGAIALCVLYRLLTIFISLPGALVRISDERVSRGAATETTIADRRERSKPADQISGGA